MTEPTTLDREDTREATGASAVLAWSTTAFTVMFAVWMMFGILQKPIRGELGISEEQYSWVLAAAILNGSLWRLPAGMLADRIGGRRVMTLLLLLATLPTLLVAWVNSYTGLLVLAFLVGFAGNSFSVGIAWNSAWFSSRRQGFALGVFGAGNVGASLTKFIAPALIGATTGATYLGIVEGGWRLVPLIYVVLLLVLAVGTWFGTPPTDRRPGAARPVREMLAPLRQVRVWRFSLYYVAVFGAYVALSSTLPNYIQDTYDVSLAMAGFLTAIFIFPASLLRPVGGWFSDTFGARGAMYGTFFIMAVSCVLLMTRLPIVAFLAVIFLLGCAMGVGKAAVYRHIPDYFPSAVGPVGGLVGMLGGLGGFFLPPLFTYAKTWSGQPTATFAVLLVLTLVCLGWMHVTILAMKKHTDATAPLELLMPEEAHP